jgi:hypothetical protein
MVSENCLRDTESRDYLIENEKGNGFSIIAKCHYSFDPLREVVYYYDDVTFPPRRSPVTCSEINAPLGEGTANND